MRRYFRRGANAALVLLLGGCYTTRVYTTTTPAGPMREDRQWFSVGGLAPLSNPVGAECQAGAATSESTMAGTDILINVGLVVAGALVATAACDGDDALKRANCISLGAALGPFLLSSRTVRYTCAAPRPLFAPPWAAPMAPPGMYPLPPAPAPAPAPLPSPLPQAPQ